MLDFISTPLPISEVEKQSRIRSAGFYISSALVQISLLSKSDYENTYEQRDVQRDGQRDEQRDEQRDVQRDVLIF